MASKNNPTIQPAAPTASAGLAGGSSDVGPAAEAGGESPKRPPSRRSSSAILRVRGGKREVKGYAVTKAELWTLGGIQAGAALCFSLAGSCFGFWSSVKQQLDFAKDADHRLIGYWEGMRDVAFYGMIALVGLGVILFIISGLNVRNIMRGTRHD